MPEVFDIDCSRSELKSLRSIARKFPKKEDGSKTVSEATILSYIRRGVLQLDWVMFDKRRFFIVSEKDQQKPDWGLMAKYKAKPHRKPTRLEELGLVPVKLRGRDEARSSK